MSVDELVLINMLNLLGDKKIINGYKLFTDN